jgi:DUF1365 family protein
MLYLWCDIDALDRGEGHGRLLSAGANGLFQMRIEDHLGSDDNSWRAGIESWLDRAAIPTAPRIHLLSLPRLLGRTFNPVGFWIGRDRDGAVMWMVAEVNNTFGERHLYVLDARTSETKNLHWNRPKSFPVSPFHGTDGEYEFRLHLTDSVMNIEIDLVGHGEGVFRTGMHLEFRDLGNGAVIADATRLALSVGLTVPRILWQAARLHFGSKAEVRGKTVSVHPWTISHGPAVLLQRIFANPSLGRLWKRFGQRNETHSATSPSGARHGS